MRHRHEAAVEVMHARCAPCSSYGGHETLSRRATDVFEVFEALLGRLGPLPWVR